MENAKKIPTQELRDKGLLFLVNTILHAYGYALVYNEGKDSLFFTRPFFTGFSEEVNAEEYKKLTGQLK